MRSIRLDERLDRRVRRAAAVEGASVSEFLRRAAQERAERTLADTTAEDPRESLADVLGAVRGGGGRARDTGGAFARALGDHAR